jgi:hypothetical protein
MRRRWEFASFICLALVEWNDIRFSYGRLKDKLKYVSSLVIFLYVKYSKNNVCKASPFAWDMIDRRWFSSRYN